MKRLDLDYLEIPKDHQITEILKSYGSQIAAKTNSYISYIHAWGSGNMADIEHFSFYVIAPEIDRQHLLITVELVTVENYKVCLYDYTEVIEENSVNIENGYEKFDEQIFQYFNHSSTKSILKKFIKLTMKRLNSDLHRQ